MSKISEVNQFAAPSPDGQTSGASSTSKMQLVQRIIAKRWKEIAIASIPCVVLAVICYSVFGKDVYQFKGAVVYSKPPVPKALEGLYTPKSFDAQAKLIEGTNLMEKLMTSFGMGIPPEFMARNFKFEYPYNRDMIEITMEWQDNKQGAAMMNKLMELFITQQLAGRDDQLKDLEAATARNLADVKVRLDNLQKEYDKYLKKMEGVSNIKKELEELKNNVAAEEKTVLSPKSRRENLLAQMEKQKRQLEELKVKAQEDGLDAAEKRINEIRRQMAPVEKELKKAKLTLEDKKADLEIEIKLGTAGVPEKVRKLKTEVRAAEEDVKSLEKQVKQFEAQIEQEKKNPTSPAIDGAKESLKNLEKELAGIDREIEKANERLEPMRQRLKQLTALQLESDAVARQLESAEAEQKKLEDQDKELKHLRNVQRQEFQKQFEVQEAKMPYFNTGKKAALPALLVPMMLFVGLLVVRDMRKQEFKLEMMSGQLGLQVLARCARTRGGRRKLDTGEVRGLALRLRSYVSENGGTVLFSSLNEGPEIDDLLANVAKYLAIRDDRVLIIDARITDARLAALARYVERPVESITATGPDAAPGMAGLVQYLVFEGQNVRDMILPTGLGSVDYLPAGGPYPMTDVLGAEPMKDLMDQLRRQYSVVLIAGPSMTAHPTDTEILAAYSQGIIMVLNAPAGNVEEAEDVVRSLRDAEAPVLGSVLC